MSVEDKKAKIEETKGLAKKAMEGLKRAKKKGEKLVEKGVDFVADNVGPAAIKTATLAAAMSVLPSEADAQAPTYDQLRRASQGRELHISNNGTVTYNDSRTASFSQAQRQYSQGGGVRVQQQSPAQQMVSRVSVLGERITVPAQLRYGNSILVYSEAYSFGLAPKYKAAYVNPAQDMNPDDFDRTVYYASQTLDGRLEIGLTHNQEYVNAGNGPYSYDFKTRRRVLEGAMGGGVVGGVVYEGEGDPWVETLDKMNDAMDVAEYGVGTMVRAGEMVGDILHIGNRVGGYIKREAKRGMGKAPSGPRRSPSSRGGRY